MGMGGGGSFPVSSERRVVDKMQILGGRKQEAVEMDESLLHCVAEKAIRDVS